MGTRRSRRSPAWAWSSTRGKPRGILTGRTSGRSGSGATEAWRTGRDRTAGGSAVALSREQTEQFARFGYLAYGRVLEADEVERLRCEYDRVFAEAAVSGS